MITAKLDTSKLDWEKGGGLVPAIVQHARSGEVLMLGWMNAEALDSTLRSGHVTFWSRSKGRMWTKGETSGNVLDVKSIRADCDNDSLLIVAEPQGPTCHTGAFSCFGERTELSAPLALLADLDTLVAQRYVERPPGSYTTQLFEGGVRRIAQKVGEEGVETALAATGQDDAALLDESADLVFHLIVLLRARGLSLGDVATTLKERHVQVSKA